MWRLIGSGPDCDSSNSGFESWPLTRLYGRLSSPVGLHIGCHSALGSPPKGGRRGNIYQVEKQCIPPTEKNLSLGELGKKLKPILDIGI